MKEQELVAQTLARFQDQNANIWNKEQQERLPYVENGEASKEEKNSDSAAPKTPTKRGRKSKKVEHTFPVQPRVIQVVDQPRSVMNHSYRDFSQVPAEAGYVHPTRIEDMTFPQKVHDILSQSVYVDSISWCDHGRAFRVLFPVRLEQSKCLQKYFGHDRYSSFLRQLANHGFNHFTQGPDRNAHYHEFMLRGLPHLTHYMPLSKESRRLIPDPEHEPDFYKISSFFPLPGSPSSAAIKKMVVDEGEDKKEEAVVDSSSKKRMASDFNLLSDGNKCKIPAIESSPLGDGGGGVVADATSASSLSLSSSSSSPPPLCGSIVNGDALTAMNPSQHLTSAAQQQQPSSPSFDNVARLLALRQLELELNRQQYQQQQQQQQIMMMNSNPSRIHPTFHHLYPPLPLLHPREAALQVHHLQQRYEHAQREADLAWADFQAVVLRCSSHSEKRKEDQKHTSPY